MLKRQQPDPNCDICGGTGETAVYGKPDEVQPCICTIPDDSDNYDPEQGLGGGSQPIRPIAPLPTGEDRGGHGADEPVESPIRVDALAETH